MVASRKGYSVRPAAADEIEAVASLFREYADTLDIDLTYQGFEEELAGLPGIYTPPAGALLLAVSADGAAFGGVGVRPLAEVGCCEMKRLYVRPLARGVGVGRALAMAAVDAASAAGYAWMRLDTLPEMAAALTVYQQLGFEVTPPYHDTPVVGTIFMRKALGPPTV